MRKHWPTIIMCIVVWFTFIALRSSNLHEMDLNRVFEIFGAATPVFILGAIIERIRNEKANGTDPDRVAA